MGSGPDNTCRHKPSTECPVGSEIFFTSFHLQPVNLCAKASAVDLADNTRSDALFSGPKMKNASILHVSHILSFGNWQNDFPLQFHLT